MSTDIELAIAYWVAVVCANIHIAAGNQWAFFAFLVMAIVVFFVRHFGKRKT
jgi:hypothetical protein